MTLHSFVAAVGDMSGIGATVSLTVPFTVMVIV